MATVKKIYYTLSITTLDGNSTEVADSATSNAGTAAFRQFKDHEIVTVPGDDGVCYIPFHAIASVCVSTSSETVTIEDANCVSAESE